MNKKILFIVPFLSLLICLSAIVMPAYAKNIISPSNNSSEIVMEKTTNRVLYEKNAKEKRYMASTTKILTAITIIENCDINKEITITKDTVGVEGSSIYLEVGEKLTIKDLLYGLMLRSGNDCAETLAVHCSGSIKDFACLMNKTAKKIGANDSNFVTPHGLHDENHYTTAYDLALISCYSMKNDTFREIVGAKSYRIPFTTRNTVRLLINKNKMLNQFEGSTGIKTGYTKKAGRCLVSSCYRDGMELICVVLNCGPMFEQSKALLTSCFNNYKMVKVVESDNIIDIIKNSSKNETIYATIMSDINIPVKKDDSEKLIIKYEYDKNIDIPIKSNTKIGLIKIYLKNNLLFTEKIYTINDVKQI